MFKTIYKHIIAIISSILLAWLFYYADTVGVTHDMRYLFTPFFTALAIIFGWVMYEDIRMYKRNRLCK